MVMWCRPSSRMSPFPCSKVFATATIAEMIAGATIPRARVATATVFAVHGAVAGSFATRIPWIRDRLDLSPGALGLALLVPALGALVAMPATGALVHRVSGRRV